MSDIHKILVLTTNRSFFDLAVAGLRESGLAAMPRRVDHPDAVRVAAALGQADVLLVDVESNVDLGEAARAASAAIPPLGVVAVGHSFRAEWLLRAHRPGVHCFASMSEAAALASIIPVAIAEARSPLREISPSDIGSDRLLRNSLEGMRADVAGALGRIRGIAGQLQAGPLDRTASHTIAGDLGCECARLGAMSEKIQGLESALGGGPRGPASLPAPRPATARATAIGKTLQTNHSVHGVPFAAHIRG